MGWQVVSREGFDRVTRHYPGNASSLKGQVLTVKWDDGSISIIKMTDPDVLSASTEDDPPEGVIYRNLRECGYYRNRATVEEE